MCVVRGGNVTPGPLTRGPGRVSGYPSEGRMSPPPYAGHQLAACTHAPCAPCAPRSQVHVLGAPVSYKCISAKCAIICTFLWTNFMFTSMQHVPWSHTCTLHLSCIQKYAHLICTNLMAKVCVNVPCSPTLKPVGSQWEKEQKFQQRKAH